jgi:hypothetical protein
MTSTAWFMLLHLATNLAIDQTRFGPTARDVRRVVQTTQFWDPTYQIVELKPHSP